MKKLIVFCCAALAASGVRSGAAEAPRPVPENPMVTRAKAVLYTVFGEEETWIKIHAAEGLEAGGDGPAIRARILQLVPKVDSLPYRVGIWRVLANTAPSEADRAACIAQVEKIFMNPASPDRSQSIETLCKLRCALKGPVLAEVQRVAESGPERLKPLALWSMQLSGVPGALPRLCALLRSPDVTQRVRAGYALRWLGSRDPAAQRAVAAAAEAEPAGTAAYPYLLSAAFTMDAGPGRSAWRPRLLQVIRTGSAAACFEACQGVMARMRVDELPTFEHLLDSPEHDIQVAAAWTILEVCNRAALPAPVDFDPTPAHPRSSEGSFASLPSGRILFCYSRFSGGGEDDSPSDIAAMTSSDGGRSWSAPRVVVPRGANRNVMSVSLLRLHDGRLAMFYLAKETKWTACYPMLRISADNGRTWGPASRVGNAPGYFELNNDRAIQLKSGRILLPLSQYRLKDTADVRASLDPRAIQLWIYSDDDGRTWREADNWWAMPIPSDSGLQEPGVVELGDGTIFSWARTDAGAQYGCRSRDGGTTWTSPRPTDLRSPESPASIKRVPGTDTLMAVYNDHSGRFAYPLPTDNRTPLVVAFSSDGGHTWPLRKEIEDDPTGWYCYTAIHFTREGVLLATCASTGDMPHLSRLRIRLVPWTWLPAFPGRDQAEQAAGRQGDH